MQLGALAMPTCQALICSRRSAASCSAFSGSRLSVGWSSSSPAPQHVSRAAQAWRLAVAGCEQERSRELPPRILEAVLLRNSHERLLGESAACRILALFHFSDF